MADKLAKELAILGIPYAGLVCAFLSFSVLLPISLAEIQVATNTLAKEAQLFTPHEHLISPDL